MTTEKLEQFVGALSEIPKFDVQQMVLRLQDACALSSTMAPFSKYITPTTKQKDQTFFNLDCKDIVENLGLVTTAYWMSTLDNVHGFNNCVDGAKCDGVIKTDVTSIVPYLFGEYVNQQLSDKKLPLLLELKKDTSLVKSFQELIRKPAFIHSIGKKTEYGMALFFCEQYFKSGIPPPSVEAGPRLGAQEFLSELIDIWLEEYTAEDDRVSRAFAVAQFTSSYGSIILPSSFNGFLPADKDIVAYVEALALKSLLDITADARKEGLPDKFKEQYKTLAKNVYASWNLRELTFRTAVTNAINETNISQYTYSKSNTYCRGGVAPSCTTITIDYADITTRYGDGVAAWVNSHYSDSGNYFSGKPKDGDRQTVSTKETGSHTSTPGGISWGCFTPNTRILTSDGEVPISELREGMRILTKSGVKQYGICSDEVVRQSTTRESEVTGKEIRATLYGFNEYEPFFTSNHVFYTTTGLRAIDPIGAQLENPWLKAGRLQVGHRVLHTKDGGETYEYVTIHSIHSGPAASEYLYGVHLREGLRSYHANGFLVHLNYPEITIASVGKIIASLPRVQQERLLLSLKELRPIFDRFGAATVFDAFHAEQSALPKTIRAPKPPTLFPPQINEMHRTWYLEPIKREGRDYDEKWEKAQQYHFPKLRVMEGILFVDGKYCLRASMNHNTLRWSRRLDISHPLISLFSRRPQETLWEHGAVTFENLTAHKGRGALFVSPEESPKELPHSSELFTFRAGLKPRWKPLSSTYPGSIPLALSQPLTYNAQTQSKQTVLAHHKAQPAVPVSLADDGDDDSIYDLYYDPSKPIPKDIDGFTSKDMVSLFPITLTDAEVEKGYTLPSITVSVLDQLTNVLSRKIKEAAHSSVDIGSLYTVVIQLNKDDKTEYTLKLDYPEVIMQNADNFYDPSADKYHNLTFKKLGSNVTLPTLFKEFTFSLSPLADRLTGTITEFNPGKDGEFGNNYRMTGDSRDNFTVRRANAISTAFEAKRAFIAVPKANSQVNFVTSAHIDAASITANLLSIKDLTLEDLADLDSGIKWNDQKVHEASQTFIFNSMLYHIDDKDRQNFFHSQKPLVPNELPHELADGLQTNLKTFLKEKYGPAYICQRLMSVDDATKDQWRRKFTAEDQKRVLYFWQGKGDGSLYKSKEYNLLNELAAGAAVRNVHPGLLDYINDTVPDDKGNIGGTKWALKLYNALQRKQKVKDIRDNKKKGGSDFTRYCNFLYALDGDDVKPNKLAQLVIGTEHNDTTKFSYTGIGYTSLIAGDQDLYQWLYDAMQEIITWVIDSSDQHMHDNIRQSLLDDINSLKKQFQIDESKSAAIQASTLMAHFAGLTNLMAATMKAFNNKNDPNGRGWGQASKFAKAVLWAQGSPKFMAAMKGVMILGTISAYLSQSIAMWKAWKDLTPEQRAELIVDTLMTAIQTASQAFDMWEYIRKARNKPGPENVEDANERIAGVQLDEVQEDVAVVAKDNDEKASIGSWETQEESSINEGQPASEGAQVVEKSGSVEINPEEPPNPEEVAEAPESQRVFNTGQNWCRGALIVCSAALTIIMCVQLGKSWDDMTLAQKILNTAQVIQMGLSVIADAAGIVVEGMFAFGAIGEAAFVAVTTVLAWAGAILVVIGFVIAICLMIFNSAKEPDLTPVEQWIQDHGQTFCKNLPAVPERKLTYSIQSAVKYLESGTEVPITITNNTSTDVTVSEVSINFWTGQDDSTLTQEDKYTLKRKDDRDLFKGQVEVSDYNRYIVAPITTRSQKLENQKEIYLQKFSLQGVHDAKTNPANNLIVAKGANVVVTFKGTLSKSGPVTMEIDEITATDRDNLPSVYRIEKQG